MSLWRAVTCAFTLATLIHVAMAIKCLSCQHPNGEVDCESTGRNISCFERLANETFMKLKRSKAWLQEPRRNSGYQCLELQIDASSEFMKGCIYENLDVCKKFATARYCRTCMKNLCNTIRYKSSGTRVGAPGLMMRAWSTAVIAKIFWSLVRN